ncbi:hypothetical protein CRE_13606 [Caenorhabditis remanei]|uniref:Uncharacterized protein n=1 Tax=Caenorhabditis remanei TaxID=31234 RepID=E3N1H4_CAERE|nr:hypothetical protein CRE_13606 [Caenorhabditis remanei]
MSKVLVDPSNPDDVDSKVEESGDSDTKPQNLIDAKEPIYDEVPDGKYHQYDYEDMSIEDSDRYPDDDEENCQWEETESDHFPDYWPGDYESDRVSIMMSSEEDLLQVFGDYYIDEEYLSDSENRMYPADNSDGYPTCDNLPDHSWYQIKKSEDEHEKPWFPIDFPSCFINFDGSEGDEHILLNRKDLGDLNSAHSHRAKAEGSGSGAESGPESGSRISEETIESLGFTWMQHFPSE